MKAVLSLTHFLNISDKSIGDPYPMLMKATML